MADAIDLDLQASVMSGDSEMVSNHDQPIVTAPKRVKSDRKRKKTSSTRNSDAQIQPEGQIRERKQVNEDVLEMPELSVLSELIETIFDEQDQQQFNGTNTEGMSNLTIARLQSEFSKHKQSELLHKIETRFLRRILEILDTTIVNSSRQTWDDETSGEIQTGVQAAILSVTILTTPNMPKQVYEEDSVQHIVALARQTINKTIYPTFHPHYEDGDAEDITSAKATPAKKRRKSTIATPTTPANVDDGDDEVAVTKRRPSSSSRKAVKVRKPLRDLYVLLCELVDVMGDLLQLESFNDSIVLEISDLAISSFFQEGKLQELQSRSLNVARTVFACYPSHRQVILDDILHSLSKLPANKRHTCSFRVGDVDIHMISALLLQLVQCSTSSIAREQQQKQQQKRQQQLLLKQTSHNGASDASGNVDTHGSGGDTVDFRRAFDESEQVTKIFLNSVLDRCSRKKDDGDLKSILGGLVKDLLQVLFLPEWPAAERILHVLTRMLLLKSKRGTDNLIRVFALESLGAIAAKLCGQRKDRAVFANGLSHSSPSPSSSTSSTLDHHHHPHHSNDDDDDDDDAIDNANMDGSVPHNWKKTSDVSNQDYEKALLSLIGNSIGTTTNDNNNTKTNGETTNTNANTYIIGTIEVDVTASPESVHVLQDMLLNHMDYNASDDMSYLYARNYYVCHWLECEHHTPRKAPTLVTPNTDEAAAAAADAEAEEIRANAIESRCTSLMERVTNSKLVDAMLAGASAVLSVEQASRSASLLAHERVLCQSFDKILNHVIAALNENDARIRTKALKALATVVDQDSDVLASDVVKKAVEARFLDKQISVREAAVDLVGRFVLLRPDLTQHYYSMFTGRLLDNGVSVRKRVVKVLREVCIQQPQFQHITQVCVALLQRVSDVDGIKALVVKSFELIWFSKPEQSAGLSVADALRARMLTITQVLTSGNTSLRNQANFQMLLGECLESKDKSIKKTCVDMIGAVAEEILRIEETGSKRCHEKLLACVTCLFAFCRAEPELLAKHANSLTPYLQLSPTVDNKELKQAQFIQYYSATMLASVVPILKHPEATFLAKLEEAAVQGILMSSAQSVVEACTKCLGSCVNVSGNIEIVSDTLENFYAYLKDEIEGANMRTNTPWLLRCLFASGLLCRYIEVDETKADDGDDNDNDDDGDDDIDGEDQQLDQNKITHIVFQALSTFALKSDLPVQLKALIGLGHLFIRFPSLMIRREMSELYCGIMRSDQIELKEQTLTNLKNMLLEEETKTKTSVKPGEAAMDLSEIGNADSGVCGVMLASIESEIRDCLISHHASLRQTAFSVARLMLRQGLAHPMKFVPHLVALTTDTVRPIRERAQQQLKSVDDRHHDLVCQKALDGSRLAHTFQKRLSDKVVGYTTTGDLRMAVLHAVYTLVRNKKNSRRSYLNGLLRVFYSPKGVNVSEAIFLAENISHFPFEIQEEPLYIIHCITEIAAVHGTQLQSELRVLLGFSESLSGSEDDEDDERLQNRVGKVTKELKDACSKTEGIAILLAVKQFLQRSNGFTELRCDNFHPSDAAKVNDNKIYRKPAAPLNLDDYLSDLSTVEGVAQHYRSFQNLMLQGEYTEFGVEEQHQTMTTDGDAATVDAQHSPAPEDEEEDGFKMPPAPQPKAKATARRSSSGKSKQPQLKKRKSVGKKKTKKKRKTFGSDDDSEEDPNWE